MEYCDEQVHTPTTLSRYVEDDFYSLEPVLSKERLTLEPEIF